MKQRDHIHSVIISYNRLELTKQAIRSYYATVTLPNTLVVVDNGSGQETTRWLLDHTDIFHYRFMGLGKNRYPGFATNHGWEAAPTETTLLHRADNDFAFLPGWCDEVVERFETDQSLGQLGMRTDDEELHNGHNVGGNCVVRRALWEEGLRYDERPWPEISKKVRGYTEDSFLSPLVRKMGWEWGRVKVPCIVSLSQEDPDDPYYIASWQARGIKPPKGA